MATEIEQVSFNGMFIPDQLTIWPADEKDYGVAPDDTVQQYLVATVIVDVADLARKKSPHARKDSLVSIALQLAKDHGGFQEFLNLRNRSYLDDAQKTRLTEEAQRLLSYALAVMDIIAGTPVALGQIVRTSKLEQRDIGKWNPKVVFIDEAGRIPESRFLIPIPFFTPTWVVATGDNRQVHPLSRSMQMHGQGKPGEKRRSKFGPQRAVSLPQRLEKIGVIVSTIRIHRPNTGYCWELVS
ncbi:hypothetical protein LZ31DRAFT_538765 [Colletotrichum somersetense]|nr:hypothetical protein LZ31DRAFT_538765 [Colletotrichum somersetense]